MGDTRKPTRSGLYVPKRRWRPLLNAHGTIRQLAPTGAAELLYEIAWPN